MTPTYSITEILDFLHLLDLDELTILGELITEEVERYTITHLSIIHTNFAWRVRVLAKKEAEKVMEQIWKIK